MHTILISLEVWLSLAIASYFGWMGIHHQLIRQVGWYLIFIGLVLLLLGNIIYLVTLENTTHFWEPLPATSITSFPLNQVGIALTKVISEILFLIGLWYWMPAIVRALQQQQELQQHNLQLQKNQATLRNSEMRFRTLFEYLPVGIIVMDLKGRFTNQSNATAEKILGYSRQELARKTFADLLHPEDTDKKTNVLEHLKATKTNYFPIEDRCIHKSGQVKWLTGAITLVPEKALKSPFAFAMIEDITQRHQQEQELHNTYQDLDFHLDNVPCAVMEWDAQLRLQRWSLQAERIFGWTAAEVLGKLLTEWQFIYEPDVHIMAQELAKLHHPNNNQLTRINRNYTNSGQLIYCEWQLSARFDKSGKPLSLFSLVRDVTTREQMRETLGKNEELYRMLAEHIHDLVCLHDIDGNYLYLSHSITSLLGYHPEELLGKSPYSLLYLDDQNKLKAAYEKCKTDHLDNSVEYRIRHQEGQYVWFETYLTAILDKKTQQVIKLVSSSRNINQHKQAEATSRDSKKQLQRRNFEIHQLYEFSRDISGALTLDTVAEVLYEHLYRLVPTISCSSLVVVDESHSDLCLVLRHPVSGTVLAEIQTELAAIVTKLNGPADLVADIPMRRLKEYANINQEITQLETKRQILLINFPPTHQATQPINGVLWLGAQAPQAFSESQLRICYTLVNHLVNALKRSRTAITQEQRNLENLVQSLPIGVLLLDAQQHIILANAIAQKHLPLFTSNSQILTGPTISVLAPLFDGLLSSLSAVPLPIEASVFELTAHLLETGPYSGNYIVIIQDITERQPSQKQ